MALAGVLALGLGSAAFAVECALDAVPASTLLFPFVSYDYDQGLIDNDGQTTLFAITNVSSDAQIVHITLWTDFSIAILDFNLTLTGYDVQTINIRDILRDGVLPSDDTGANEWWNGLVAAESNAGPPPFDDGPYSTFNELHGGNLDAYFALNGLRPPQAAGPWAPLASILDCNPITWVSSPINYRAANNGNIPAGTLDIFQDYLQTSQIVPTAYANCGWTAPIAFTNGTWFTNQLPRATWMYITADVVNSCNKDLPDGQAAQYFSTAPLSRGVAVANVLMGDVLWLDNGNNFSEADNAVHLEANPGIVSTPQPTGKMSTFYHNLHGGIPGTQDWREPLPTAWGFRTMMSASQTTFTWIRAWRGSMNNAVIADLAESYLAGVPVAISDATPAALYSNSCVPYTYYAWDEDENVNAVGPGFEPPWSGGPSDVPIPVPNLFPLETQEVAIDEFFIVKDVNGNSFGWMMVIWGPSNGTTEQFDDYQSWMGVKYAAFGQYTAGLSAAVLANYNCDATQVLPVLGIGMYSP
jgi:hypothetical protein